MYGKGQRVLNMEPRAAEQQKLVDAVGGCGGGGGRAGEGGGDDKSGTSRGWVGEGGGRGGGGIVQTSCSPTSAAKDARASS